MTTIGHTFRHDDRVALFIAAMCMASNDVENALNSVDETSALHGYYVRMALAHTVEGLSAYDVWLRDPDVKSFIGTVDTEWSRARRTTATMRREVGSALRTARNHTFHYPAPGQHDADSELSNVLTAIAGESAELTLVSRGQGKPTRIRFHFADTAATMLALREFTAADTGRLRKELDAARAGCVAFVRLVGWLFDAYSQRRGLQLGNAEWQSDRGGRS